MNKEESNNLKTITVKRLQNILKNWGKIKGRQRFRNWNEYYKKPLTTGKGFT